MARKPQTERTKQVRISTELHAELKRHCKAGEIGAFVERAAERELAREKKEQGDG